jgi:sulfur-oxidizing protein SoxY
MDQVSRLFIPPHFVKQIEVSFNGEQVMSAETDIAISENPSFRFYFVPNGPGTLVAKITDSKGLEFTKKLDVGS